jgi:hypothetical protein
MQHTDSFDCGLLQCGGNEHFMVFNIDDFSKYNYVYLIKDKSDEFERFKDFFLIKLKINSINTKIKRVRSDS